MDAKKLNSLLNSSAAQEQISVQELDQLIDVYPYVYQLHAIKARKLGDPEQAEHLLTMTGAGWMSSDISEHEFIALEDIESVDDSVDVEAAESAGSSTEEEGVEQSLETEVVEQPLEEIHAAMDTEAPQDPETVVETVVMESYTETVIIEVAEELGADVVVSSTDKAEFDEAVEDTSLEEVVEEGVSPEDVAEHEMDEIAFMGEDYQGPADEDYKVEIPEVEDTELVMSEEDITLLKAKDQVMIRKGKKNKKKKKAKKEKAHKEQAEDLDAVADIEVTIEEKVVDKQEKKSKKSKKSKGKKKDGKSKKGDGKEKEKKSKKSKKKKDKSKKEKVKPKKATGKSKKSKKGKVPKSDARKEGKPLSYKEWLLAQEQISNEARKRKKKRKKKAKVVKEAMKSLQHKSGVISEPLAELLVAQGHSNQAIAMYRELSLNYPKKSSYFAGRIEELQNNK